MKILESLDPLASLSRSLNSVKQNIPSVWPWENETKKIEEIPFKDLVIWKLSNPHILMIPSEPPEAKVEELLKMQMDLIEDSWP